MLTQERIDQLKALIAPYLDREPDFAAYLLQNQDVVREYKLSYLAGLLASEKWGCHKNDVLGIIELLERHLDNGTKPEELDK